MSIRPEGKLRVDSSWWPIFQQSTRFKIQYDPSMQAEAEAEFEAAARLVSPTSRNESALKPLGSSAGFWPLRLAGLKKPDGRGPGGSISVGMINFVVQSKYLDSF